jgi:hypothetical protein
MLLKLFAIKDHNEGLQAELGWLRRKEEAKQIKRKKAQVSRVFTRYLPPARYPIEKAPLELPELKLSLFFSFSYFLETY